MEAQITSKVWQTKGTTEKYKSLIVPHTELYHEFQLANDFDENQIKLTNLS
jgi:hypothetical protein